MSSIRFSRRNALLSLGLGAAFLPVLRAGRASADMPPSGTLGPVKRAIFLVTSNGTVGYDYGAGHWPNKFWPEAGTETSFTLSEILKPLVDYQSKLLVLEGIDVRNALDTSKDTDHGSGHDCAPMLLTGTKASVAVDFNVQAGNISLDQYLANQIQAEAPRPIPSLNLAALWEDDYHVSWKASGIDVKPQNDPLAAFQSVFAGGTGTGAPDPALLRQIADRRSVLDYVHTRLDKFRKTLGTSDRQLVEAHFDSIRELEARLAANIPQCTTPTAPAKLDFRADANYDKVVRSHMDIALTALSCDLTRVVTFELGDQGMFQFSFLGSEYTDGSDGAAGGVGVRTHHDITHRMFQDQAHMDRKVRCEQWYMEQIAYLVKGLDTRGLLDDTVVFYINQMGNGASHGSDTVPCLVLGGSTYFRLGRHLKYGGTPQNGVLTAIANAVAGGNHSYYGDPAYGGELANLR